jgi:formate/nitrite transporter FocA (FNT family)
VLGLLASGVLFLWLAGTDLPDGRWERVDLANAILFAAAVMVILSARAGAGFITEDEQ